jgi:hypothetical protein
MRNDLSEARQNELASMNDFVSLHLTLGMYIRNKYELSDITKVPKLIQEYKTLNDIGANEYEGIGEDLKGFYQYIDSMFINDDEISNFIIKLVQSKLGI